MFKRHFICEFSCRPSGECLIENGRTVGQVIGKLLSNCFAAFEVEISHKTNDTNKSLNIVPVEHVLFRKDGTIIFFFTEISSRWIAKIMKRKRYK